MHYLMFKLGDASVPSDIWLLLITAEIILQPTEIGYSCDFAWWLKPTAWIWTLQQGGPTPELSGMVAVGQCHAGGWRLCLRRCG